MKTNVKLLVYAIMALAITITSCSKDTEVGPIGPKGEQGIQGSEGSEGPAGTNGTNGSNGADGEDGNANVYFSDKFFPEWNDLNGSRYKRMIITNPNFTKVTQGGVAVFVYWTTNNGTTFVLPYSRYNSDGTLLLSRSFYLRGNNELFLETRKFGSDFVPTETDGQVGDITYNRIRYIIVPSGNLAAKSQLNYSNYDEVKNYYNISE